MRRIALLLTLCLAVSPAFAAEKAPDKASDDKGKGPAGTNVEMPFLMAPMTTADGRLSGYAYISSLLTATSPAATLAVRDKLAFIQDMFLRDVNGAPVAKADDPTMVDNDALSARLLADAKKVMGPGQVTSLTITLVQIAPIHPKQTEVPASQLTADLLPPPSKKAAKPPAEPEKPK